jgi:hypothetical protein
VADLAASRDQPDLVPLGCWTSASLLDVLGGQEARPASQRLVGLVVLATLPTAPAGMSDWANTDRRCQRVGVVHAAANGAALGLFGASYLARRRGRHARGIALGMAGGVVSSFSGLLGGHLSLTAAVTKDNVLMPSDTDEPPAADPEPHAPVSA